MARSSLALQPAAPGRPPDPKKRAAVLESARKLFLRDSYDASLEAIALMAGVSRQTIYNLFGSKDELFVAVLANRAEQLTAPLDSASDAVGPRAVLSELGRLFGGAILSAESVQFQRAVIACAQRFPKLAQSFYEAGPAKALGRIAAYLEAETKRGRLAVSDPRLAAEHFVGMLKGNLHTRLMFCGEVKVATEEIERRTAYCVESFLKAHGA
jgi:TetR/AcrR family transcriptional repressor of mexJK operon